MSRPGFVTWTGLAVVLTAAAVLSFDALRELAITCRIDPDLAFLLPVAIDAGAAVSTRAWLSRRANADAERFARRLTWALLGLTVTGNATHQIIASDGMPAWLVAVMVLVGAVPAAVMGAAVHLAVLLGRPGVDTATEPSIVQDKPHVSEWAPDAGERPVPTPASKPVKTAAERQREYRARKRAEAGRTNNGAKVKVPA